MRLVDDEDRPMAMADVRQSCSRMGAMYQQTISSLVLVRASMSVACPQLTISMFQHSIVRAIASS